MISKINAGDADDWYQNLFVVTHEQGNRKGRRRYADATISKFVKRAKQFFDYATDKGMIEKNPFRKLKSGGEQNSENQAFIDRPTIEKVIDQAPDSEWKAIVALCRFGGLRCPSEIHALKWTDFDWHSDRFRVTSDKTKRYNKGFRIVPIFPEWFRSFVTVRNPPQTVPNTLFLGIAAKISGKDLNA